MRRLLARLLMWVLGPRVPVDMEALDAYLERADPPCGSGPREREKPPGGGFSVLLEANVGRESRATLSR